MVKKQELSQGELTEERVREIVGEEITRRLKTALSLKALSVEENEPVAKQAQTKGWGTWRGMGP